jgi:hypothetical protein
VRIARLLVVAAVLAATLAVAVWLFLDEILEVAFERGGTRALGVRTEVAEVEVGPFAGTLSLSELTVANPEGFTSERFLSLKSAEMRVEPRTVLGSPVVVSRIAISGVQINLEGSGRKTNYGAVLESVGRLGGGEEAPARGSGDAQAVLVREILIKDVSARLAFTPLGRRLTTVEARIPEFKLVNVSSASTAGGIAAQIAALTTTVILQAVLAKGQGFPGDLSSDLRRRIGTIDAVTLGAPSLVEESGREVLERVRRVPGAGEAVEGAGKLLKGLGGLLQGEPPPEKR